MFCLRKFHQTKDRRRRFVRTSQNPIITIYHYAFIIKFARIHKNFHVAFIVVDRSVFLGYFLRTFDCIIVASHEYTDILDIILSQPTGRSYLLGHQIIMNSNYNI